MPIDALGEERLAHGHRQVDHESPHHSPEHVIMDCVQEQRNPVRHLVEEVWSIRVECEFRENFHTHCFVREDCVVEEEEEPSMGAVESGQIAVGSLLCFQAVLLFQLRSDTVHEIDVGRETLGDARGDLHWTRILDGGGGREEGEREREGNKEGWA